MTEQEKDLLIKDLSARLPYGVKMSNINAIHNGFNLPPITVEITDYENSNPLLLIDSAFRPYLRPMSSMTKEELHELLDYNDALNRDCPASLMTILTEQPSFFDYLNSHHFDYRGLIPMGLALEAPDDMYKK